MKRAILIFTAALLVVLSYPSTQPLADGSNKIADTPSIISKGNVNLPPVGTPQGGGNPSDGDADDINGIAGKTGRGIGALRAYDSRHMVMLRMWWFMMWSR
jgi:hypothetical protein